MEHARLRGTYECTLDDRSRIAIPARVREHFEHGAIASWWIDPNSVILVPRLAWDALLETTLGEPDILDDDARELSRYLHAGAFEQESLDKQGRITIPAELRDRGGLSGRLRVIGVGDYLEVWDSTSLDARFNRLHEEVPNLAKRVRLANRDGS